MQMMIRSLGRRYGVAMVVSALALVITYTIGVLTERHTFMLGFAAVTVSAWYGGLGPGLAATAVSMLVIAYVFVPPSYSLALGMTDAALLGVFVGVAALITWLITDRKRAQDALRRAHEALENQVQERTAALAHTNEALQAEITQRQEAEAALALRLADYAAIAIQNARLYAEAARRQREAEGLAEVGYLLTQSLDPADVAQGIVEGIRKLFHARAARLYLLEAGSGDLMQVALSGNAKVDAGQSRLPRGVGVSGLAVHERQPVVTRDALTDPRITYPPHVQSALAEVRSRAVLSVPLLVKGDMIGALSLSDDVGRVFEAEQIQLAQTFIHQAALAMENARLFAEIQEGRDRLQSLSRRLLETQEMERQHLARELHDEAGQALTALKINLELLQAEVVVGPLSLPQRLAEAVALTTETLEGIRRLAHALRPPLLETLGLSASLEGLCTEFGRQIHLAVTYESTEIPVVPEEVTLCLYRCLQESLTNVAKHACAKHVWVTLHRENATLSLSVEDNGQGFDTHAARAASPGSTGMGLLGIRERLELLEGWMEIDSTPGRGTSLTMYLPLQEAL